MMQKINLAYEVLSDSVKRQQYNLEWKDKLYKSNSNDGNAACEKSQKSFSAAKSVLEEYFRNIMDNRFDFSYELISSIDKLNITKDDFISWQRAVSVIFHLTDYSCKVYGTYKNKLLNGHMFEDIMDFSVNVVEYNAVMDMVDKNTIRKMTVLEYGKWRVFVGYEKLQPLISKFKALTSLLTAKSVIGELVEAHSKVDSQTGLLNQRGIIERAENEILRFNRYGNVFSIIMCDIDIIKMVNKNIAQEAKDHIVKSAGEILVSSLRRLDSIGRWGEKTFLILLPETSLSSAVKVIDKINRILGEKKLVHDKRTYKIALRFGAAEYASSLEESLDRITGQINL
jgi:diguanylate cyclase (GGDEF)-like protein